MNNKQKQAQELLKEHRESIDRLDAVLIYTLGERFKQTQMVGKLKAEYNLPPADPAREQVPRDISKGQWRHELQDRSPGKNQRLTSRENLKFLIEKARTDESRLGIESPV